MTRAIVTLAVLAALLFGALRLLGNDEPQEQVAFVRLVDEERARALQIAGVSVHYAASDESYLYVYRGGLWRCATAFGALALTQRIEQLTSDLVDAVGEVRSADPRRGPAFGLGDGSCITVSLHGARLGGAADGDVLMSFELGHSLPGLAEGRSFVRLAGAPQIFEIQHAPRHLLERRGKSPMPPMLDERLLAGEWPQRGGGLSRAFLDYADGRSLVLQSSEQATPGLARHWTVSDGAAQGRVLDYRIAGWQAFLYRAPYAGFSDPAKASQRGLAKPRATLTLIQVDADPIELSVGELTASGAAFVLNNKTGQLCLLEPEVVSLLLPSMEGLCEPKLRNPWEAWLPR